MRSCLGTRPGAHMLVYLVPVFAVHLQGLHELPVLMVRPAPLVEVPFTLPFFLLVRIILLVVAATSIVLTI